VERKKRILGRKGGGNPPFLSHNVSQFEAAYLAGRGESNRKNICLEVGGGAINASMKITY